MMAKGEELLVLMTKRHFGGKMTKGDFGGVSEEGGLILDFGAISFKEELIDVVFIDFELQFVHTSFPFRSQICPIGFRHHLLLFPVLVRYQVYLCPQEA